jgi:cytochrome c-type biogenesis protein
MKKYIYSAVALVLAVVLFNVFSSELESAENSNPMVFKIESISPGSKDKLIDFTYTENGQTKSFADLAKGKVVFLNFWGTWCPPCRGEIPDIIKLKDDLKSKDILIVGVALERATTKDKLAKVSNFHKANKLNYINFVDADHKLSTSYGGMKFVPTTLIINKKGEVVEMIQGARPYAAFMESINKVL